MSDKQPDALRLADALNGHATMFTRDEAAAELRRQHTAIAELVEALSDLTLNVNEAMGTGGWVPTPLHASFWAAMADGLRAIAKHGAAS